MALENATYINQLREDAPSGLDPKSQGDDHLRLIKGALKRTFPYITGPVNVNEGHLNLLGTPGVLCPTGMIAIWGNDSPIPYGWVACDGVQVLSNGRTVPNLMDTFIRGWGHSGGVGYRGGRESHSHGVSVSGTAITVEQMPSHRHRVMGSTSNSWLDHAGAATPIQGGDSPPNNKAAGFAGPYTGDYNVGPGYGYFDADGRTGVNLVENTGASQPHYHSGAADAQAHIPPYYSVIFIIKT